MEVWQTILLAFSGNAALFAVLGFLGKSLIEKILIRDSQRLEYELKSKANVELEKLRSVLAITAVEHQIRFVKLHERRAEVITEIYSRLRELHTNLGEYVKIFEPAGCKQKDERRRQVVEAHKVFIDFYSKKRIFLSIAAVQQIEGINIKIVNSFNEFFYRVETSQTRTGDGVEKWIEIFDHVNKDITVALENLEDEFRRLLGDKS